jgi:hypothetical protein
MGRKAVQIAHPRAVTTQDEFVNRKPEAEPERPAEPMIRLSVDVPESLHTRIKLDCVAKRRKMAEVLREMMEQRWPAEAA